MRSYGFDELYGEIPEGRLNMVRAHFDSLVGGDVDYYGADTADHTFKVDGVVFKILEDPDDGYRSHLGAIDYTSEHSSIFFQAPVARVVIIKHTPLYVVGWKLIDREDGHVWLEFGTDHTDDYYPYFYFRHMAKEPK
jgi:hypothetical protein